MSVHQFEVEPGIHTITASAQGYVTQQRTVDVQQDMTVEMTLQPVSTDPVNPVTPDQAFTATPLIIIGGVAVGVFMLVLLLTRSD